MPRYRSSIEVAIPPEAAFAFVSDLTHAARWDPRVERAEKLDPGPVRRGTRFVLVSRVLGVPVELPYEVEELEPGRRVVFRGRSRTLRYRDEIHFAEVADVAPARVRLTYDAVISLRGPLALANPLLALVFRRIGDDALAGIRAALLAEARRLRRRRAGAPAAVPAGVGPDEVRAIVALDDPVLRNLLITRGYHLLSARLAERLGRGDANWCTYAAWASKTAGFFIREEEVHAELRRVLERKADLRRRLRGAYEALRGPDAAPPLLDDDELGPVLEVSGEIGRFIAAGNRTVFEELGGLFAAFLAAFADDTRPDAGKLADFVARLQPGEPRPDRLERDGRELVARPEGGQDLLRTAVAAYHAALFEPDPKRRGELVLLGNALGGVHEQTRLQSYIAGSLGVPVAEIVFSPGNDALLQRLGRAALGEVQEAFHRLAAPLGEELVEHVRAFSTLHLMRMEVPGEVLQLGRDLPAPRRGPLFPPRLARLEHPELVAVLGRFGAYPAAPPPRHPILWLRARVALLLIALRLRRGVALGSAAADWGDLAERMRYICFLFRSRQCDESLFLAPFTEEQMAAIEEGRVPVGKL